MHEFCSSQLELWPYVDIPPVIEPGATYAMLAESGCEPVLQSLRLERDAKIVGTSLCDRSRWSSAETLSGFSSSRITPSIVAGSLETLPGSYQWHRHSVVPIADNTTVTFSSHLPFEDTGEEERARGPAIRRFYIKGCFDTTALPQHSSEHLTTSSPFLFVTQLEMSLTLAASGISTTQRWFRYRP